MAEEAAASYEESLAELTFNSKPIINSLTMIAEELLPYADAIANAIERRIGAVAADKKLPLMYLIDSISKNVGKGYKDAFAKRLPGILAAVFPVVLPKVRTSLQNLVKTWPGIFPSAMVKEASAIVSGNGATAARAAPSAPPPAVPVGAKRPREAEHELETADPRVPDDLHAEIGTLVTRINTHVGSGLPADPQLLGFASRICALYSQILAKLPATSPEHVPYLSELGNVRSVHAQIQHAIESEELQQPQLPMLNQPPPPRAVCPPPPPQRAIPPPPPSMGQMPMGQMPMGNAPMGQMPMGNAPMGQMPMAPPTMPMQPSPMAPPPPPMAPQALVPPAPPASAPPVDVSKLLASLAAAGVLQQPAAGAGGAPSRTPPPPDVAPMPPPQGGLAAVLWKLHEARPLQCKTCGVRFGSDGREELRKHMDFHFRRNMRGKAGGVAPPSRRLMLPLDRWITYAWSEAEWEENDKAAPSLFDAIDASTKEAEAPAAAPVPVRRVPPCCLSALPPIRLALFAYPPIRLAALLPSYRRPAAFLFHAPPRPRTACRSSARRQRSLGLRASSAARPLRCSSTRMPPSGCSETRSRPPTAPSVSATQRVRAELGRGAHNSPAHCHAFCD